MYLRKEKTMEKRRSYKILMELISNFVTNDFV